MDQTTNITPSQRIQPLSPYQGGGQHQRLPFNQGQLLQGVISAKSGPNQFTIEIDGRQIQAESTAQLQVGQKLSLQVAALTPQVELHIVNSNTVNRLIGNTIHLIGQQAATFPVLADLAEISGQMPQLSTHSKETLRFYADSIAVRSPVAAQPPIQPSLTVQLLNRAAEAFAAPKDSDTGAQYKEISNLLQQLAQTASLSPETAERADSLAVIFSQAASLEASTGPLQAGMGSTAPGSADDTINLLNQLGKLHQNNPQVQDLIGRLMPLLTENASFPATHPLQQLVALLAKLDTELVAPQPLQGPQLREVVERLGINMEQLLANNSREKAVQTLKHALLELAQQLPAGDKSSLQADQIVKSMELYHLLQVRLAGESLIFMPLPLSFLDQGYLLIDADRSKNDQEKHDPSEKPLQHFELHLQLEGLGNLQIDFREKDGGVTLKFTAADAERAKFLAGFRGELDRWLTAANLESVQFLVGAREPVKSLLGKIMGDSTGIIDTNA